jgi:hypothetical protein
LCKSDAQPVHGHSIVSCCSGSVLSVVVLAHRQLLTVDLDQLASVSVDTDSSSICLLLGPKFSSPTGGRLLHAWGHTLGMQGSMLKLTLGIDSDVVTLCTAIRQRISAEAAASVVPTSCSPPVPEDGVDDGLPGSDDEGEEGASTRPIGHAGVVEARTEAVAVRVSLPEVLTQDPSPLSGSGRSRSFLGVKASVPLTGSVSCPPRPSPAPAAATLMDFDFDVDCAERAPSSTHQHAESPQRASHHVAAVPPTPLHENSGGCTLKRASASVDDDRCADLYRISQRLLCLKGSGCFARGRVVRVSKRNRNSADSAESGSTVGVIADGSAGVHHDASCAYPSSTT